MDEFDVLKQNLPLKDNINKYLLIKTKVNYPDDWESSAVRNSLFKNSI